MDLKYEEFELVYDTLKEQICMQGKKIIYCPYNDQGLEGSQPPVT